MPLDPDLLCYATPEELQAYEKALELELALDCPAEYATVAWDGEGEFQQPPHIALLNQVITALIEGKLTNPRTGKVYKRLLLTLPPRHGKSEFTSKFTPAWYLSKYPGRRVMLASYEADFASDWGRKVRNLIDAHPEFGVEIDPTSKAANRWNVKGYSGGMVTAGVGGPITGKGAHLLIIDDPVKNQEEANSDILREKTYDWATSTAFTRLEPGGVVIIIQTRWHHDDLAGRMLERHRDDWFHFDLPAIAGERDVLGREPGAALWPERYDIDALAEIRNAMPALQWAALYQQQPQIEGGNIFRKAYFRYFTVERDHGFVFYRCSRPDGTYREHKAGKCWVFQTVDLAVTTKTTSDYTVVSTWAVTPDKDLLLLSVWRDRIEGSEHEALLDNLYAQHRPRFQGVERATFNISLIQTLRRKGKPVRELIPDKDKVSRAYTAAALTEGGRVYFLRGAPWLHDWEQELLGFDNMAHDDQVDTFAYAALQIANREGPPSRAKKVSATGLQARVWEHQKKPDKKKLAVHPQLGYF